MNGDMEKLVEKLKALANPLRLRIIASLAKEPKNVYRVSKELGLSYPLTHLHVKRLKKLGFLEETKRIEQAEGMPSQKFYAPTEFIITVTPEIISKIVREEEKND